MDRPPSARVRQAAVAFQWVLPFVAAGAVWLITDRASPWIDALLIVVGAVVLILGITVLLNLSGTATEIRRELNEPGKSFLMKFWPTSLWRSWGFVYAAIGALCLGEGIAHI